MSIRVMTQIWECSSQKGSALLLLLAIADNANEAGEAWPSVATLARKVRMSERAVHYLLDRVKTSGELQVVEGGGRHRPNLYRITLKGEAANSENFAPITRNGAVAGRKGAKTEAERVQKPARKGATATAPEPGRTVNPEPSIEPGSTGGGGATRAAAARVEDDEEFVSQLIGEFGERLGEERVRLAISKATNARGYVTAPDRRRYVRDWLVKDALDVAEGRHKANGHQNGADRDRQRADMQQKFGGSALKKAIDAPPEVPEDSPFLAYRVAR